MEIYMEILAYDCADSILREYGLALDGDIDSVSIEDKKLFLKKVKEALDGSV